MGAPGRRGLLSAGLSEYLFVAFHQHILSVALADTIIPPANGIGTTVIHGKRMDKGFSACRQIDSYLLHTLVGIVPMQVARSTVESK
jgi:hypothetical protein